MDLENIVVDITQRNYNTLQTIQYDVDSRYVNVKVVNNGKNVDLTNYMVSIACKKPDGKIVFNETEMVEPKQGLIKFLISEQISSTLGEVVCELKIYGKNSSVLTSQYFTINVTKPIANKAIQSTNEFRQLTIAMNDYNAWVDKVKDKYDWLEEEYAEELSGVKSELEETNAQLSRKADKNEVFTMANMGQDVKEAMTGGSVAVVDGYSVGKSNIIDGSVTPIKLDYYTNLIDKNNVELNKVITPPSFVIANMEGYAITDFISVQAGEYTINFASYDTVFIYNKDKTGVSSITTSTTPTTFEVSNDGYVRFVIKIVDLEKAMAVHGNIVPSSYIPFGHISWLKVGEKNLEEDVIGKINRNEEAIATINGKFVWLNLFDVTTVTDDVMLNYPSDNLTSNTNFCVSDYIPVEKGKYTLNIANYDTVFLYDSSKTLKSKLSLSGWGKVVNTVDIPNGIYYIRLSVLKQYKNEIMVAKGETISNHYVPFGNYSLDGLEINTDSNPLKGRKALFTGDSICYGAGSTGGYPKLVGEANGMVVENYGISGSRIANTTDRDDSILSRISQMDEEADYVCLEGGVNDAWSSRVQLGEISSGFNSVLDETTFTGAFESLLKQSIIKWKEAKIFYIIPHKMIGVDEYMDRAKALCEKWGVPCLDLRLCTGIFAYIDDMKQTYTASGDGVHPNKKGYMVFYVDKISAFMKSL